jgi:hypothetical protein
MERSSSSLRLRSISSAMVGGMTGLEIPRKWLGNNYTFGRGVQAAHFGAPESDEGLTQLPYMEDKDL